MNFNIFSRTKSRKTKKLFREETAKYLVGKELAKLDPIILSTNWNLNSVGRVIVTNDNATLGCYDFNYVSRVFQCD